jgi:hypothetical protein
MEGWDYARLPARFFADRSALWRFQKNYTLVSSSSKVAAPWWSHRLGIELPE